MPVSEHTTIHPTLLLHTAVAYMVMCLLVGFHITLLVLVERRTLDQHLFSLDRLGQLGQLIAFFAQAGSVILLTLLNFVVQTIARDRIILRR